MISVAIVLTIIVSLIVLFLRWKKRERTVEGHRQIKRLDSKRVSTILGTKPLTLTIENQEWIGRPNVFNAEWVSTPRNSVNFAY